MVAYYDHIGSIEIYFSVLNAIIGEERSSMIDLGCAFAPNTPMLRFKNRTYVDVVERKLDHPDEQQYFHKLDILKHNWNYHQYHTAFCLDVIEHLTPKDGIRLIEIMEDISEKQVLFTPLDNIFGLVDENNKDPEAHRSLWKPEHLPDFAHLIFPNYHKQWNGGAFFMFKTKYTKNDFEKVKQKLKEYGIYERDV